MTYNMQEHYKNMELIKQVIRKRADEEEKCCVQLIYLEGFHKISHGVSCGDSEILIVTVFNPDTMEYRSFKVNKDSALRNIPNDVDSRKMFDELLTKQSEESERKAKERNKVKENTLLGKLCRAIKHYVDCIEE